MDRPTRQQVACATDATLIPRAQPAVPVADPVITTSDDRGATCAIGEEPARLLIVADVRLYREGMQASLSARKQFCVVGAVADGHDALRLTTELRPDVAIVDMATKHSFSIVRSIRSHAFDVRLVGLGVDEAEDEILACAEAGLAGYVPRDASLDELVRRVECVLHGELLCTPQIAATLFRRLEAGRGGVEAPLGDAISAREQEVLLLIREGHSNKDIATRLHIEVCTVKHHVHSLLEKLNVKSRAQAAARLHRQFGGDRRGVAGIAADRD